MSFLLVPQIDFRCPWLFSSGFLTTPGVVVECRELPYGEDRYNIAEIHFAYAVEGFGELSGVSYSPAVCPKASTEVEVEYLRENPVTARISGMRCRPYTLYVLLILFLPALAGIGIVMLLQERIRMLRFVRSGILVSAKVVSKSVEGLLKLRFSAYDGQIHDVVIEPEEEVSTSRGATVRLLYDPSNPSRAILLSDLPGPITGLETGQLTFPGSFIRAIPVLLLPVATLVVLYLFFVPR